jgi:F-type H+-transporting ATPase subunit gamma
MKKARPYGEKIRNVAAHMSGANTEYRHPFLIERDTVKRVGIIVVTSDKGLCGGLNTNVLRKALNQMKIWQSEGEQIEVCCIGNKGFGFIVVSMRLLFRRLLAGDTPDMARLIGAVKVR